MRFPKLDWLRPLGLVLLGAICLMLIDAVWRRVFRATPPATHGVVMADLDGLSTFVSTRKFELRGSKPQYADLKLRALTEQSTLAYGWALTNLSVEVNAGAVNVRYVPGGAVVTFEP